MQLQKKLLLTALIILFTSTFGASAQDRQEQSSEMQRQLEEAVENAYSPGEPGAAVIVTRGENTLLRTAIGVADLELDVALSPDMIFRIGSLTKQFTAAAIMKLEDQGLLSVEDPIMKHLQDYPGDGRTVTIRQLLNHVSGITTAHTHMRRDFTLSELIDLFKDYPLTFKPGAQFEYNNNNYILLGAIIEKISGKTYSEFLAEQFFEPLGMADTSYDDFTRIIKRRAKGYQGSREDPRNANFVSMSIPYAAGALISSVDDMVLWNSALFSGKVISLASLKKMKTSTVDTTSAGHDHGHHDGVVGRYGFGLFAGEIDDRPVFKHSGSVEGFYSYNLYFPKEQISVVILQNTTGWGPDLQALAEKLAGIVLGIK